MGTRLEGNELNTGEVESTSHYDGHALTEVESVTEDEEEIVDEVQSPNISESDDSFVAAGMCVVNDHMDADEVVDYDSSESTIADNTVSSFIQLHIQFDN